MITFNLVLVQLEVAMLEEVDKRRAQIGNSDGKSLEDRIWGSARHKPKPL